MSFSMNYTDKVVSINDDLEGDDDMNLKRLRLNAGLTQEQLATKCDVQRTTITMIELGENSPSYDLLIKLSKVLNCTTDELAGEN